MRGLKKSVAVFLAVSMFISLTACADKNADSNSSKPQLISSDDTGATDNIVAAEDGPRVYIGNTTAKAGEYAEVTLYVENAEQNWCFCGIHVTFPDVLEVKMLELGDDDSLVDYRKGEASKYSSGATAMLWTQNMPEELTSNNLGCFFFAEMFADNYGLDGDIATFQLKIPEDAESGTVYPIGFYYMKTDTFQNKSGDLSLEKYTFENLRGGSITVE